MLYDKISDILNLQVYSNVSVCVGRIMLSNRLLQDEMFTGMVRGCKFCLVLFGLALLWALEAGATDADLLAKGKIAKEQVAALEGQLLLMQEMLSAGKSGLSDNQDNDNTPISAELERLREGRNADNKLEDPNLVDGPSICQVSVSKYNTVSVHAQNVKISTILQELSVRSRKNIILAAGTDRVVSMTFYTVPFYKALKTMLDVNGLAFVENNNFVEVFTKETLSTRILGKNGMQTRVFRLNYLRPKDALIAAQELLSSDGKAKIIDDDQDIPDDDNSGDQTDRINKDPVYKPNKQRFAINSALVVYDYKENIAKIEELLDTLDIRPKQILLEATILEVTLVDDNQFGIDFSMLSNVNLTNYFGFANGKPENFGGGNFSGGLVAKNSFKGGIAVGDVAMLIHALDQITDVSVLSRPKVLSLDRQRARVLVGKNVGYLETSYSQDQIVQSVKFIQSGISLDVRPYIVEDGKVRLVLAPRISDVTFNELLDAKNNTQKVPTESVQTVAADIVVPAGATAVIGGLFQEATSTNRTQIPGYGDIPVLGAVGRTQTDKVTRRELIFLIKPIVLSDDKMESLGERELCSSKEMLAGVRNGLLPWSRLKQCRQLNLRAYRNILTNDRDIGFWLYRRSLQLRSDQNDVCRNLSDIAEKEYCQSRDDQLYKSIDELINSEDAESKAVCVAVEPEIGDSSAEVEEVTDVEIGDNSVAVTDISEVVIPEGIEQEEMLDECSRFSESLKNTSLRAVKGETEPEPSAGRKSSRVSVDTLLEEDMFDDFDEAFAGA